MQTRVLGGTRDWRDEPYVFPSDTHNISILPPSMKTNPLSSVCTKHCRTSVNKVRCPINTCKWMPNGSRLVTGTATGEFTLWDGMAWNFLTIQQAHTSAVRDMVWSHDAMWMLTSDNNGEVKYWAPNLNNVKSFVAHSECCRALRMSPNDQKLATCSDDSTVKIWDFAMAQEEKVLTGHGWDVKTLDWHPTKSVIASGSKDNQVKVWDARSGQHLQTLHGHKNTVTTLQFNQNGNWLLTGGKDQVLRVYDLRMFRELQHFQGHNKEVSMLKWHPIHQDLFASAGIDGQLMFWLVGTEHCVDEITEAHDGMIWCMDWHPLGHLLCTGSNDQTTKFWCRQRPGADLPSARMGITEDLDDHGNVRRMRRFGDRGGGFKRGRDDNGGGDRGGFDRGGQRGRYENPNLASLGNGPPPRRY